MIIDFKRITGLINEIKFEIHLLLKLFNLQCTYLIYYSTHIDIDRTYKACSLSIWIGSKNKNLLQVSLQLLINLQNTFLLHRYT